MKGIDVSDGEVVEAKRRFEELKQRRGKGGFEHKPLKADFEAFEGLGDSEWSDGQEYDVVTCMFAM